MADLVDTNVWLALVLEGHPRHNSATTHFRKARHGDFCFCSQTMISLARLLSTPAIMQAYGAQALSNIEILGILREYSRDKKVGIAVEPENTMHYWRNFSGSTSSSPKLWMDAYLAGFAVAGGMRLVTLDKGFAQFPSLDCIILE